MAGVLPAVLALLMLLTGCSGDSQEADTKPSASSPPALPALPTPTFSGGPDDLSSYQAEVLEDGTVTQEEYSSAVEAQHECVEAVGAQPGPIEELPGDQLGFYVDVSVTEEGLGDEVLSQKVFDCASEYVTQVGVVWSKQHAPTEEDYARLLPPLVDCLRAVPLEGLGENPSRDEVVQLLADALAAGGDKTVPVSVCMDENQEFFRS